MEAETESSA